MRCMRRTSILEIFHIGEIDFSRTVELTYRHYREPEGAGGNVGALCSFTAEAAFSAGTSSGGQVAGRPSSYAGAVFCSTRNFAPSRSRISSTLWAKYEHDSFLGQEPHMGVEALQHPSF